MLRRDREPSVGCLGAVSLAMALSTCIAVYTVASKIAELLLG